MADEAESKTQPKQARSRMEPDAQCMAVLTKIEQDRKNLQPTPNVGTIVGWLDRYRQIGSRVEYRPAMVVSTLSPGRVDLQIFGEIGQPMASGAQYIGHPKNMEKVGSTLGPGGGWFYLEMVQSKESFRVPAEDLELHQDSLKQREQRALEDCRQREAARIERERIASQLRAQNDAS